MYVCLCNGISEEDIKNACTQGRAKTPNEVLERLNIGKSCGICLTSAIENILDATHQQGHSSGQVTTKNKKTT